MRNKKGLTLIELLAVIAIIAILFILLVPQITKAVDKSRVSGIQVDLHSYEVGMRAYFMEHFGEAKTVEKLNTYLDKSLQFELVDGEYLSKAETNPYGKKYELTSDWQTYMQINSYTDEKDPRIHAVRVYEEGNEVKSIYIGFDDDKRASEVDTTPPLIVITPNGGEDVENIFVDVTDNNEVFSIQYAWTKDVVAPLTGWQSISNNTELNTVFLGKGTYYLHIKASDMDMNVAQLTSETYVLGDSELPVIKLTVNGSPDEKIKHTTIVNVTDNKGVDTVKYVWSDSETRPTTGWKEINTGDTVTTPDMTGQLYLHVEAIDISGNVNSFVSKPFNTGDTEKPVISLSPNGSTVFKDTHTTVIKVTDNDEVKSVKYAWSISTEKPTTGWTDTTSGTTVTTPTVNGELYLFVEALDRTGNRTDLRSLPFKTGDSVFPSVSISPNGSTTRKEMHTTTITATDNKGIKKIEYVWTESDLEPVEGLVWKTATNKEVVSSSPTVGNAFLHIKVEDIYGNVTKFTSKSFNQGEYTYEVTEEGTKILKYLGSKTELQIPEILGGKPVIELGISSFVSKNLTSVTIPKTVKIIGGKAFQNNLLTDIELHEGIETIGESAFYRNTLTEVKIPNTVVGIGNYAFRANAVTKLTLGDKVDLSGLGIFMENTIEGELVIPEGVKVIGQNAFSTNSITSLILPSTLEVINSHAFNKNSVERLEIPNGVTILDEFIFSNNALKYVKIPANVTKFTQYTFQGNRYIETIINCSSVNITKSAFDALTTPVITNDGC